MLHPSTGAFFFFKMFALLDLDVVPMKFTLLSGMLYVGQHKHAFPTSVDTHFPESNAHGDAALFPQTLRLYFKL